MPNNAYDGPKLVLYPSPEEYSAIDAAYRRYVASVIATQAPQSRSKWIISMALMAIEATEE